MMDQNRAEGDGMGSRSEWPLTRPPEGVVRGESIPSEADQNPDQPTRDPDKLGEN